MILDTNALSAFIDGDPALGELLRHQARACIPVIVLGEFRYGIAQSRHRAAYEQWLESELRHFEVLPVTDDTTVAYAALRVSLKQKGKPIPANPVALFRRPTCGVPPSRPRSFWDIVPV